MTHDLPQAVQQMDAFGFDLPTPEEGLIEGKRRLALTLRRNELVWLVGEQYDPTIPAWSLDIVRQGANGQWVRQRSRFDEQAQVLYYLGETPLSSQAFRAMRQQAMVFPVADWQDRPA
jgi:hypothetical protein